ncbi:MAG: 4Fe-4S dicluster domain-containing protein [Acidobacteria bacterium]|nr:4Fe-4S dicluster domain-containing protein [Acidobacteriota bacterium]
MGADEPRAPRDDVSQACSFAARPSRGRLVFPQSCYIRTGLHIVHPTFVEAILLIALALASFLLFLRSFLPVVRTILRARPEPGYKLGPIGRRIREFVWEVLVQGKVIRERPLPGLAHAFVFWGFCAFALVSLDHLARGVGLELLSPAGAFGRFYFGFAALFAIAVGVSIVGLAARRFLVRPSWLGAVSGESGLIAFLIFALMATYLLTFELPGDTTSGRINWWAHTLSLFVFLPLIPRTKHLHLVLSPVAIFLERPRFSQIPPLAGDEDFGIETGKDLTRIMALQAFSCVECGRCTEHCPANNTGKVLDPKKIALGVRQYLRDHGPRGDEPLVGRYISEEALFQCTTCGACEYQCPVGIQHVPMIQGLRRGLVNTGKWEDEHGHKLFHNLERQGNSLGFASSERDRFVQKSGLPVYDGTQEYCLWLGCMGAYDPQGREIILALARVLRFLGVSFGVLKRERCTGDPVRRLGNDYLIGQLVEYNLEQLKAEGVTRLISICPHCVRTIGQDWAEYGETVSIEHHSEFLARHIARLPQLGGRERIVFHDPCYLGRYRGLYDEPREPAERSLAVIDPPRARQRSFCCGAGGGLAFLGEEKGKRVNIERAEELVATGADAIGAACPFCRTMFRDALARVAPKGPRLLDIAQIVADSLPVEEPQPPASG